MIGLPKSLLLAPALALPFLLLLGGCSSNVIADDGGGGQGGGNTACLGFDDEVSPGDLTFHVRNDTALDIYLPANCGSLQRELTPKIPVDDLSFNGDRSCLQTCESLQSQGRYACGACQQTALVVPAFGSRDFVWDRTALRTREMPLACFEDELGDSSCQQEVLAPSGQYTLSIRGFSSCGPNCACNADGECVGEASGQEAFITPVDFSLPGNGVVEYVFEACAFGCAGEPSP